MKFIVPIYFLYDLVGMAFLFGMMVVLLAMPFTFFIARQKIKKLSKKVSEIRDERVRMCGEIIKAIQTVKCLVWEPTVQAWIGEIRTKELNMYFSLLKWAVMMVAGTCCSLVVCHTSLCDFRSILPDLCIHVQSICIATHTPAN